MRKVNGLAVGISALALAAAGYAIYEPYTVRQDAAAVQTQAKSLADQVAEACAKGGPVAQQLGAACAKAAEVKQAPPVAQAATVDPAELRQAARTAVAEYCAAPNHPCRGADGSTPPFDAIVDAVLAKIPTPKNGADGQAGANATAEQVASAVAAYCGQADEPCRGKPGTAGQNGKDGQPPPCMAEATQCRGADGQPPAGWTTSYSDGTTETCSRASPFDPAAPHYTCTRSAPPPSSSSPPLIPPN